MGFNIPFKIEDYKHILPEMPLHEHEVLNYENWGRGNFEECYWRKEPMPKIITTEFREREARRILREGVWVFIKNEIVWIPPNYYFSLQYGRAGSVDVQFRLKRLKQKYFSIEARNNPNCIGVLVVKNRGDGMTTESMSDCLWECAEGNMEVGGVGVQSKTLQDGKLPCWNYIQTFWQSYPMWLKKDLYSDFISGDNIAEKMQWQRDSDEERGIKARNVMLKYYPSGTPMDGKHDLKKIVLDEAAKWEECSFYDVLTNYKKIIIPGFERRGLFEIFSSPADHDCKSNNEVYELWKDSNTDELTENGTTKSRIHRHYSNPLDGIAGSYDKYGDADPDRIYKHIMSERANMPKDKLLAEVRGYPLNEQEMFASTDGGQFWSNHKGISERKIYLLGTRFKDEKTKEPVKVYGNLDWLDGVKDYMPVFRQSDKYEFDVHDARFCFSYLPKENEPLKDIFNPPNYVENCTGIDSVDKRYAGKRPSNFAMVNQRFRDLEGAGIIKCPTMIYCNRPLPIEISYEDAIKAAIFNRSMVQVESLNTKIVDYFEDRGYINWMISKIGQPKNSLIKGDAPSGKSSAFIDEIVGMLDSITNIPYNPDDLYPLQLNWFLELLEDVSKFNLKDTHSSDLSMAWGQSLLGCAKLLFKKQKAQSPFNNGVFKYLLS